MELPKIDLFQSHIQLLEPLLFGVFYYHPCCPYPPIILSAPTLAIIPSARTHTCLPMARIHCDIHAHCTHIHTHIFYTCRLICHTHHTYTHARTHTNIHTHTFKGTCATASKLMDDISALIKFCLISEETYFSSEMVNMTSKYQNMQICWVVG